MVTDCAEKTAAGAEAWVNVEAEMGLQSQQN